MKLLAVVPILLATASAFTVAPQSSHHSSSTSLNLFGSGNKVGEQKGPGMMDQLAMFKKAQEMAQKKNKLDQELAKETFIGEGADGKVKAMIKFVPVKNPMDPNPDYEATKFEFDDDFYASASPDDLSEAIKTAIKSGVEKTNLAVAEKYTSLQTDLMEALGGVAKQGGES